MAAIVQKECSQDYSNLKNLNSAHKQCAHLTWSATTMAVLLWSNDLDRRWRLPLDKTAGSLWCSWSSSVSANDGDRYSTDDEQLLLMHTPSGVAPVGAAKLPSYAVDRKLGGTAVCMSWDGLGSGGGDVTKDCPKTTRDSSFESAIDEKSSSRKNVIVALFVSYQDCRLELVRCEQHEHRE